MGSSEAESAEILMTSADPVFFLMMGVALGLVLIVVTAAQASVTVPEIASANGNLTVTVC